MTDGWEYTVYMEATAKSEDEVDFLAEVTSSHTSRRFDPAIEITGSGGSGGAGGSGAGGSQSENSP